MAANLPSNFSFHAQSTRACCATRRERERNAREERRRRTSSHDTTQARSSRGGVGGEKSIRLVVGRFLRGQEVGQACPCPPPRVYTRPTSVQFVRSLDGMDEDRSILRGNAPTRRFLVLIPRDGNRCVPLAHCYGNERSRRYLPILDRPLQIVFLIATRVLFARLPGNVIYQIVGVFIAMKFETRCFQAVTTNLLFPPCSIDAPSQE